MINHFKLMVEADQGLIVGIEVILVEDVTQKNSGKKSNNDIQREFALFRGLCNFHSVQDSVSHRARLGDIGSKNIAQYSHLNQPFNATNLSNKKRH